MTPGVGAWAGDVRLVYCYSVPPTVDCEAVRWGSLGCVG